MLLQKFKIDIDRIKKRNEELMGLNWIDGLSAKQKKFLNWRKGPPKPMNRDGLFGYPDLSTYLLHPNKFCEIPIDRLDHYMTLYEADQNLNHPLKENITRILQTITRKRIRAIQRYIKLEDSIFKKGIYSRDTIYRVQTAKIDGTIIWNTTSWSLRPSEWFCTDTLCHLYITRIPNRMKVLYLENNSKDKNLSTFINFPIYEFEYILPRNIEFKETKTKKINIPNPFFDGKIRPSTDPPTQTFICHWIEIMGVIQSNFPVITDVKLVIPAK